MRADANPPLVTSSRRGDLVRFALGVLFIFATGADAYLAHGHISLTLVIAADLSVARQDLFGALPADGRFLALGGSEDTTYYPLPPKRRS